jgi:hypothetical protein
MRAQIIADAAHCRGCQRFWEGGRLNPSLTGSWKVPEQSQNTVEVRRGEAWVLG